MLAISLWIHNPHSGNRDNFLLTLTATIFKWTRIIIISGSTITRQALRSPRLLTLSSLHIKSIVCECRMSKWNINIDSCYALDSRTADHQSHGINVDDATRLSSSSWRSSSLSSSSSSSDKKKTIPRRVVKNQCVYANCIFFGRLNDFWSGEFVLL